MKVFYDDASYSTTQTVLGENTTPAPDVIPTRPTIYKKSSSETKAEKVLQDLFNHDLDFQTPDSKFKNFYTYLKNHQELWQEYKPFQPSSPIAIISLGDSKEYKYGVHGEYYLLRHKHSGVNMDFLIVAKQKYQVFSIWGWLNPIGRIVYGNSRETETKTKTKTSYFLAKFQDHEGE